MLNYFKTIYKVGKSLIQGMLVTWKSFWQPSITVQFPDEKLITPERFRGALTFDKETCTACNLCVKACPTACISLEPAVDPATKKRIAKVSWYQIDFGKCNYCRLCEEACPTKPIKSVRHTHQYEWGMLERKEMFVKWERMSPSTEPSTSGSTNMKPI
ncbi:MAG: NADH-quinone oxidoreductase subunit I [Elusimicrobia bacterium]|nr:NADH-quinone oxidoreductase subunit I [Elusimicrobiota bacterium]